MNDLKKIFISSAVISEVEQSDIYMTVKARLFETPGANLNGVRVTAEFIDQIIDNEDRYVGLPLYADVKNLLDGNYEHLGHLFDPRTGEFHSVQIGSFYEFEKETTEQGFALVGSARIPKRNKELAKAIGQLFADGSLKFSFQISCAVYTKLDDGTIEIGADKNNRLEGMAIVSFPACENAVALQLVAEISRFCQSTDDCKDGENDMQNEVEKIISEVTEAIEVAETVSSAQTTEIAETETAGVVVEEVKVQVEEKNTFDTETCEEVRERTQHVTTTVSHVAEEQQVAECAPEEKDEEAECKKQAQCKKQAECKKEAECKKQAECAPQEQEDIEDAECSKKRAETLKAEMDVAMQKLESEIVTLRAEIEMLKEELSKNIVAEVNEDNVESNPFVSEINAENTFSLLASAEKKEEKRFSLLDKA